MLIFSVWFHFRHRPLGRVFRGMYMFLRWVYPPTSVQIASPSGVEMSASGGDHELRMSNPSKTGDAKTTLNRIRKEYAQNPLYVWLFSASCTFSPSPSTPPTPQLDQCLTRSNGIDSKILPSLPRYPCLMVNSPLRRSYSLRRVYTSASDYLTIGTAPCWATP
jgi:hypothetical protein